MRYTTLPPHELCQQQTINRPVPLHSSTTFFWSSIQYFCHETGLHKIYCLFWIDTILRIFLWNHFFLPVQRRLFKCKKVCILPDWYQMVKVLSKIPFQRFFLNNQLETAFECLHISDSKQSTLFNTKCGWLPWFCLKDLLFQGLFYVAWPLPRTANEN